MMRSGAGAPPDVPPWAPMAAATIAAVMVATAVAATSDHGWPGAVHLVALPPLDLTADLRLLLARSTSVPAFVLGALASFIGRSMLLAAMLARLDRDGLATAGRYMLVVWPFSFVAAALQYAGVAAPCR
jgi:hypothetical protein